MIQSARLAIALTLALATQAQADAPLVVDAWLTGTRVDVTLAHPDTGWEHYADGWEVITEDGTSIGLRVLAHPHVTEQPFTRSLTLDAAPPEGPLYIRARCSRDGWFPERTQIRVD